jgi:competence protein ComEC
MTPDAFSRYRASRPGPGSAWFGPNALILLLAICVGAIWYFAYPRVAQGRVVALAGKHTDRFPDGVLTIVQLDVGQGDATFIHTPGGYNVLIDCGEGANPENEHSRQYAAARFCVIPFLEMHGITSLDLLILTHPDSDHGGGMGEVIDWIYGHGGSIGAFVDPGVQKTARFYKEDILGAVERHSVPYIPVLDPVSGKLVEYPAGILPDFKGGTLIGTDVLGDPTIAFQILGPLERIGSADGDEGNNNSIITRVQCGGVSFLSAGDAETEEEDMIVAYWGPKLKSTIHFMPHHGSKTSDQPNWLRMVNPELISTSSHAPVFGHPAADAINAWKLYINPKPRHYLRTDLNGDIWYRTDGQKIAIRTQFEEQNEEAQWTPGKRGEWRDAREFAPNEPTMWSDCKPVPGTDSI